MRRAYCATATGSLHREQLMNGFYLVTPQRKVGKTPSDALMPHTDP